MDLTTIKNKIEQKKGQKLLLQNSETELEIKLNRLKKEEININNAQIITQTVAKQTQEELVFHVSPLVTSALSIVYDDPYKFNLIFDKSRGKTEALPVFIRDGKSRIPGYETGEGPVDIASFGLRLSLWCLNKNNISNILIFDEPFKNLDENALPNAIKMIKILSERLKKYNIQFIIITHNKKEFLPIADTIIEFKKRKVLSHADR